MPTTLAPVSIAELTDIAKRVRSHIVQMVFDAQSGHPGGSLSAVELGVSLFWNHLRCDPANPDWPERDRFILSKGHATPFYYSLLAERGYFSPELLRGFRTLGSPLQGHPSMGAVPGIEMSSGSLGQGLSFAIGHALSGRLDRKDFRCWVMMGDGELNEGQIWEAAMGAAKYQAANLTAILDYNKYQQTGASHQIMPSLEPVAEKWRAFGWHVQEIDGHDMAQILQAFATAQQVNTQPQIIIAHTLKGRGLSPFTADPVSHMHGKALDAEALKTAFAELEGDISVQGRKP